MWPAYMNINLNMNTNFKNIYINKVHPVSNTNYHELVS